MSRTVEERELLGSTIDWLKREFAKRWPDAIELIPQPDHPRYNEAACLWLGFKEGYIVGMLRSDE